MTPKVAALCVHIEKSICEINYSRPFSWFLPGHISPKHGDVLLVENYDGVALVMCLTTKTIPEGAEHPQKYVISNLGRVERYLAKELEVLLQGYARMLDDGLVEIDGLDGGWIHYWDPEDPCVGPEEDKEEEATPRRERRPRKSQQTEIE